MKTIYPPGGRLKAFLQLFKRGVRALAAQPWPVLLVLAIALALLITIVPLVLGLFCVLLLLKLVVQAVFGRAPRQLGISRER